MTDLILETGKVQTRDGRVVRIYSTDGGGIYPVHGAIKRNYKHGDEWVPETWSLLGSYVSTLDQRCEDLVPIPQPQYFTFYTYENGVPKAGSFYNDLEALVSARKDYVAMPHARVKSFETFQYLDGEITKVEESSNAD
ncbi:MAG TPA: hypothetical protein DCW37_07300 [Cellvibrionales bacterium]|nr:hypothetical protein [Cellvibrionales bacterium]